MGTWGTGARCPNLGHWGTLSRPQSILFFARSHAGGNRINHQSMARTLPAGSYETQHCLCISRNPWELVAWSNNRGERCHTNTAPGRFYRLELSQVHPDVIPSEHSHRINRYKWQLDTKCAPVYSFSDPNLIIFPD